MGFPLVVASRLAFSESGFEELPLVALKTRPKNRKPTSASYRCNPCRNDFVASGSTNKALDLNSQTFTETHNPMIRFLVQRPIAVSMALIAIFVVGFASLQQIPISLMPDVKIPEITVRISQPELQARQLDATVVSPLRNQLLQVGRLNDVVSQTQDGQSTIRLTFDYGVDTDLAYIEVNEKIDRMMSRFPRGISRPVVVKASALDIPAFYLNLSLKDSTITNDRFLSFSEFTQAVIKRRLEQQPEIAIADISGQAYPEITIIPDENKINSMGITLHQIEEAFRQNNLRLGSILVRQGNYRYNISFSSQLSTKEDVANIYFNNNGHLIQLKDFAEITERPQKTNGIFTVGSKRAITIAVVKQADARMDKLRERLLSLRKEFAEQYADVEISVSRDQTILLEVSISNLKQSLILGGLLAFLLLFLFLRNPRIPILIGITIPCSLIVSILLLHTLNISINIVSLTGLILGIGMIVDNSIVVIDNIGQHLKQNKNLLNACVDGANEVVRPLISSVLTTCAVFVPMIFMSGITGALFYDQAVAVSVGLLSSLIVSVVVIPTYYHVFMKNTQSNNKKPFVRLDSFYERGHKFFTKKPMLSTIVFLAIGFTIIPLSQGIESSKMPNINQNEVVLTIDWNENISVSESHTRVKKIQKIVGSNVLQFNSLIGEQQFLLDANSSRSSSETEIYIAVDSTNLQTIVTRTTSYLRQKFPKAKFEYKPPENIFERLFRTSGSEIELRLMPRNRNIDFTPNYITRAIYDFQDTTLNEKFSQIPQKHFHTITPIPERLELYKISIQSLYTKLAAIFSSNLVDNLQTGNQFIPITIGGNINTISETIEKEHITSSDGTEIPIRYLIKTGQKASFKTIFSGKDGEYLPFSYEKKEVIDKNIFIESVKSYFAQSPEISLAFYGNFFSNKILINQLIYVLLISLSLLYLILAIQFESLLQPLIILIEVPIDIAGSLFLLWIFNETINLMSIIGIIIMSGIVINDSIIKIDTINQCRKNGMTIDQAVHSGGLRRINSIVMTSLTTVLALVPVLFFDGLGSQIQRPMSLAVIGGLSLGTIVSLFFIPLLYKFLYKNSYKSATK